MYAMVAMAVVLFWIVGMVTGMVAAVFLLRLEQKYVFQPVRNFITEIKNRLASISIQVPVFLVNLTARALRRWLTVHTTHVQIAVPQQRHASSVY